MTRQFLRLGVIEGPTISLANLVKKIKLSMSKWIKENTAFSAFTHWQDGYGAFTVSHHDKDSVIEYIKKQEEHHKRVSFVDELKDLYSAENQLVKALPKMAKAASNAELRSGFQRDFPTLLKVISRSKSRSLRELWTRFTRLWPRAAEAWSLRAFI